ncbi:MAG: hypothetical protein LKE31_02745 [Bacilli bacterium]|nr:hypothetical protein [Bacilli bacterium]MCH4277616.1 hypothetical protein [Bacilli bacterium]
MNDFTQQMLAALAKGDVDVGEIMNDLVRSKVEKGTYPALRAKGQAIRHISGHESLMALARMVSKSTALKGFADFLAKRGVEYL